jgi:signal transduction histidine kinase
VETAQQLARLAELETRFGEALERAKLAAMAELAAGAGHEINNPLTVIIGRARLLLETEADLDRRQTLATIIVQATRVTEMIADLMLFARPPQPAVQTLDVAALVGRCVAEMAPQAAALGIAVEDASPAEPILLSADPAQLQVALRAVLGNGVEAISNANRPGRIVCGVRRAAEMVEISVADDGPGIAHHVREHLFDPFFAGRQAGRGLGMGLAKAWRIAANHGGRLDAASSPGQGAVFTFVLPAPPTNPTDGVHG